MHNKVSPTDPGHSCSVLASAGTGKTDIVVIPLHMKADYRGDFAAQRALEAHELVEQLDGETLCCQEGLDDLVEVSDYLTISGNPSLLSLDGLSSLQRVENIKGQMSLPGTLLDDLKDTAGQDTVHFCQLPCNQSAEQGMHTARGKKIASLADPVARGHVVTVLRMIQGLCHEFCEAEPAALQNLPVQMGSQRCCVRLRRNMAAHKRIHLWKQAAV